MVNDGKHRRGRVVLGVTARLLMLIASTGLCLSYVAMFFNPARAWFMTVFSLSFVPFVLLNFFLLLWALLRRSRSVIIPFLALLPCLFLAGRYIQGEKKDLPSPEGSIKIISYNVGQFMSCEDSPGFASVPSCSAAIYKYLQSRNADIICLQEFYARSTDEIKDTLSKYFPGYIVKYYVNVLKRGVYGNVTLSRHPILDKGKLSFEKSANMALYTDVEAQGQIFRVYNCHFESYNISIPRLLDKIGSEDGIILRTEEKVRSSIRRRPRQVDAVVKDINSSETLSVIAGDFNDTPLSYTYNALMKGHKDTFIEAGEGILGTFSAVSPFLRIDYILFPEEWLAASHYVAKIGYSDHYPVETQLIIR